MSDNRIVIKAVVVGDGAVGKTCLMWVYCNNTFPEEYIPTVFDNFQTNITIDNKPIQLCLWDTAGQDDYDKIRPLSYAGAHVFIVCYSVVFPTSFRNVKEKWQPEISHHCDLSKIPVLLLGMKEDLRNEPNIINELKAKGEAPITAEQAEKLIKELKWTGQMACSAKTGTNVQEVFSTIVRYHLTPKKKSGMCGTN